MKKGKSVILYDSNDYRDSVSKFSDVLHKTGTQEEAFQRISEIDTDIDQHVKAILRGEIEEELQIRAAISILLQGRNYVATAVGLPRRDPHVAVYAQSGTILQAAKNYFGMMLGELTGCRIQTYSNHKDIFSEILKGAVIAVVCIGEKTDIQGSIRHYVKNLPDWDMEMAYNMPLPPCIDAESIHLTPVIARLCRIWESVKNGGELNFLSTEHPSEVVKQEPLRHTKILIVDDEWESIDNILSLFKNWGNTSVEYWHVTDNSLECSLSQNKLSDFDIVLLDHDLGKLRGVDVLRKFHLTETRPIIVSTTLSPNTPAYVTRGNRFQLKRICGDDPSPAIEWFNSFFIREGFML